LGEQKPQDQHYLPRFYLRQFLAPELVREGQHKVWVRRRGNPTWEAWPPKKLAALEDLYTGKDAQGNRNDFAERYFHKIESKMGKILKEHIRREHPLDTETKAVVAYFVALQLLRVPHTHREIGRRMKEYAENWARQLCENPQAFEKAKREYEANTGRSLGDDFTYDKMDPSRYIIEVSKGWKVGLPLEAWPEIGLEFWRMSWTFLRTDAADPFITSDDPVFVGPKAAPGSLQGILVHPEVEVTFPIAPTVAVFMAARGTGWPLYMRALPGMAEEVNRRVLLIADEYIVSSQRTFPGDHLLPSWDSRKPRAELAGSDLPPWTLRSLCR